ncbi:MAG: hypothetical protein RML12_03195 [Xanthomonadales bacterium]|nr:hypothetical protein [Xanthomonadales bacterium]
MLITCAACGQRISNKHPACPHCQYDFRGSGAGLSLERARGRVRRDRAARWRTQSYLAMLLALLGAGAYYWQTGGLALRLADPPLSLYVMTAGAVWYLVARVVGALAGRGPRG